MRKTWLQVMAGAAMASALMTGAQAAPVLWTLNGVVFDDGSTASGSFVYDAATNQYTNIQITTTATPSPVVPPYVAPTTPLPGNSYSHLYTCVGCTFLPGPTSLRVLTQPQASNQTGLNALRLQFPALTDAGGAITLSLIDSVTPTFPATFEGECIGVSGGGTTTPASACPTNDFGRRLSAGQVVGTPVAAPASVPTLGEWSLLALAALVVGAGWRSGRAVRQRPAA